MRLICPTCSAIASLEAWVDLDASAREVLVRVAALPDGMPRRVVRYLGLFRKPGSNKALMWPKSARLLEELEALVTAPEVSWKSQRVVPNGVKFWLDALDQVLERDRLGLLERPLANHNYLRATAHGLAEKAFEAGHRTKETTAARRQPQAPAAAKKAAEAGGPVSFEQAANRCRGVLDRLKEGGNEER